MQIQKRTLQGKSKLHHSLSFSQNQKLNSQLDYKQLFEYQRNLRMSLQKQLEIQKIKVKKLLSGKLKGKICQKCLQQIKQKDDDQNKIVENLKEFSTKMASTMIKKDDEEENYIQASTVSHPSTLNQRNDHVPILQNFTIFGLPDDNVSKNLPKSCQQLNGQILYFLKPPNQKQQQAAHLIFPSGVAIKNLSGIKAKDKAIQIMSFCYTNLKSFILSFKDSSAKFPNQNYNQNSILKQVNNEKSLFFVCIGIRDYTWVQSKANRLAISLDQIQQVSSSEPSLNSDKQVHSQGGSQKNQMNSNNSSFKSFQQSNYEISLSQRVFCISSYFPFFTFFQQILRSLINNIKMERLHIYKMNGQDIVATIKQTDSRYQLKRISQLFNKTMSQILLKKMYEDRLYEIKLINQQKITLLTSKQNAKTYFADQWIFAIMNMFTLDTFLDLWTQIILEEGKGIVFICDNSHILTYTVYLFGNILVKPFNYALPTVNIIPQDQGFLDSPFPVIYGMFKKRKYVQQNQIIQRYNDRTYVFLNPEKIQIVYSEQSRKNVQKRKPSKLKSILAPLFNQLKKFRKKQTKATKYQIQTTQYSILASQQQKQISLNIVSKINQFVLKEVLQKIPTKNQIYNQKKKVQLSKIPEEKTIETFLISLVSQKIRKKWKDPFIDRFLDTQTFSNYLLEQA